MKTGKIIVINGPSGVGKTTLYKRLLKEFYQSLELSISATTRGPREGEVEGKDYYFLDQDTFKKKIDSDEFVEWALVYGNYYGTLRSEIERITRAGENILLDIDVQGGESVKRAFPDSHLIFILPPSTEELIQRLKNRNTEDEDSFNRRIETSKQEIEFYHTHKHIYSFAVINRDLEKAYSDLSIIIRSLI